jgi:hypothetical protein
MTMNKLLVTAALATAGALAVGAAQAREVDVQWSVTLGTPIYAQPAPVYVQPAPAYGYRQPAAVYSPRGYHQPSRWDRDGDGIPNRYDRVYNPRWDRDGDGIPNRFDRHDGHGWNDGRGGPDQRGGNDGRGGNDARDGHGWGGR